MTLLQIDSSARTASVTRRLTAKFADEWKRNHPGSKVIYRDLLTTTLPPITDDWDATRLDPSLLSPAQQEYLASSDELIAEVQAADLIVIGAPMYNFSNPPALKGWIDQIVRFGKTFTYGPAGPRGLLEGKGVVVITARGGSFQKGTHWAPFDFQEPYLRHIFGFIGVTNVEFVHADNQLREQALQSFETATERIVGLVADSGVTASSLQ